MRPKTNGNIASNQWQAKQNQTAHQNEQKRLAYNHAWQRQQKANRNQSQSANTQARRQWQQQQARQINQERNRLSQQANKQRANQLRAQQQKRLAQEYAAQQVRKQSQQYAAQQARQQSQQYATQQARQQSQQYATQQASRQQNQRAQYLALLQRPNNTPHRVQPQSNISNLSPSEIRTIGDKIFRNESGGDIDKLVHWNVGENFASMGIGHFTWYPAGRRNRYGNTFPGLLDHLQKNGVQLPVWVQKARHTGAPWRTKNELKYAKNSRRVQEFQNMLYNTRYLQASYIFERAKRAMPRLVKATPPHLRGHVAQNLNAVANTRGGWYALIDYVNFKGEGLSRKGGYKGQNWGLLQVLENMRPSQPGQMALNNFADSAIQILQRRVRNSNPSRGESRWMRGWTIRCNTYRQPFVI